MEARDLRVSDMNTYETRNAYVAAFLNYAGLVLLEAKRIGPKSVSFIFLDDAEEDAEQLEQDFWNDRQAASPRALLSAYCEIRRAMYETRKELG